jgi:hypothetical protein
MSTVAARAASPVIEWPESRRLTLAEKITALGITVPDQKRAAYLMEVNRLGLEDGVSKWWLKVSPRRLFAPTWAGLDYTYFERVGHADYQAPRVPDTVQATARKIREKMPNARLAVLAKYSDPWLKVIDDDSHESLILAGWDYDRQAEVRILL